MLYSPLFVRRLIGFPGIQSDSHVRKIFLVSDVMSGELTE
jgi:hypothetical protein